MIILLTYDIHSNKARQKLHKFLKEFGLNTQKSVFECDVDREGLSQIVHFAKNMIDPETDSVRIYKICGKCLSRVQISGLGVKITQLQYMII